MISPFESLCVLAHAGAVASGPRSWGELARAWEGEPLLVFGLLMTAWIYRRGARRLRARVAVGRGLRRWEVVCFWAGWWTLVASLLSPLHAWGQVLFAAHMTQHELLMLVAAPLLVLGRPLVATVFALPTADARQLARWARRPAWRGLWRMVTHPLAAWAIHAVALWTWHVPRFFEATLTSEWVHHLQHVSFFGSALLFWWAVLHGRPGWGGYGAGVLYLFTTMVHSGLLGALLTFADDPLYPAYGDGPRAWALTPLEDQQVGGLIMWVPAGLVYVFAALAMIARWLRTPTRRGPQRVVAATA